MGAKQDKEAQSVITTANEEKKENYDVENYIMKKPCIIIIGIAECPPPNQRLRAVPKDVEHMRDLWINEFKYDPTYVTVIKGDDNNPEYIS